MRLAKLEGTTVIEILENQDYIPSSAYPYQYIDITNISVIPSIGYEYIGDNIFINRPKHISKLEFRNRFTQTEKLDIDNSLTNPNLPDQIKAILTRS